MMEEPGFTARGNLETTRRAELAPDTSVVAGFDDDSARQVRTFSEILRDEMPIGSPVGTMLPPPVRPDLTP